MAATSNGKENASDAAARTPALEDILNGLPANPTGLSRREFLRLAGVGAVALGATASGVSALAGEATEALGAAKSVRKSTVLIVKHPKVLLSGYKADPGVLNEMITVGLQNLTKTNNAEAAWRKLFKSNDRVCMKHNRLSSPSIWTHTELNEVITDSLSKHVEIDRKTVVAWNRGRDIEGELAQWSKPFYTKKNNIETRIVRALSDYGTGLINLPILKTHGGAGVTIALKNHLGTNDNPGALHKPGGWDGDLGSNIADLNTHPAIKDKTRLIIVDAIRPLYDGGPSENTRYRWDYNGLILGTDPVAVDTVGLAILEAKRRQEGLSNWQLGPGRKCLSYAETLGLGNSQGRSIRVFQIDLALPDHKPVELPLEKVA